jgi:hypothetical protein
MTAAAVAIGRELYARNSTLTTSDPMAAFDMANGRGIFSITDETGTLDFKAEGSGGTKSLSIVYKANEGSTLLKGLDKVAEEYRAGTGEKKKLPTVPDSMGRL